MWFTFQSLGCVKLSHQQLIIRSLLHSTEQLFSQSCISNSAGIVVVRENRCDKFKGLTSLFLSHGRNEKYEVVYPSTPVGPVTASRNRNNDFFNQSRFSQSCSSNSAGIIVVRNNRCDKFKGRTLLFLSHGRNEKYEVVYPFTPVGSVTACSNRNNDFFNQYD